MSILTTFLAGFLLYGTSRYFPESLHAFQRYLVARKLLTRTLGILLMVVAVLMFSFHYTWGMFSWEFCDISHNTFFKEPFGCFYINTRSVYCPTTTFHLLKNDVIHIFRLSISSG